MKSSITSNNFESRFAKQQLDNDLWSIQMKPEGIYYYYSEKIGKKITIPFEYIKKSTDRGTELTAEGYTFMYNLISKIK
jgi:hypothetical protein